MTGATFSCWVLDSVQEFFDQYNQGYQYIKEHQNGTLTFIHA